MILAHNKSLLTYLHKAIEHRGIADGSVGYYVGGMKEADLKASESRKVIIATYAMASEGLDIKTLTTLIMASPKTDVCQSVGRILRVKHGRPLVIDIVDQQDIFRNQWHKRRAYYVKQNYDILMTDSPTYDAHNPVEWTPDHVAKANDAKKTKAVVGETKPATAKGWAGLPITS
jgi:superfamily II DNA or RNA helicase